MNPQEQEILRLLQEQQKLIEAIYKSSEKTRKYFQWTFIITILLIVVPAIGLVLVVSSFSV